MRYRIKCYISGAGREFFEVDELSADLVIRMKGINGDKLSSRYST